MKIVAFLQNPWFQPGTQERHILMYRDNQEFHRRVLLLSMSGRRLQAAFGPLYDEIHWDNTSWRPADTAPGRIPIDWGHMFGVIEREQPDLALAFGNQAKDACMGTIGKFCNPPRLMVCHHPNARHRTQADLNDFAQKVRDFVLEAEIPMWKP